MTTTNSTAFPPSPAQAAILHEVTEGAGNLIVQARAGSGKTALLAMVCNAIPRGTRVVALAFNTKNANEFSTRLRAGVDSCTLNSLGYRAVRAQWPGARPENNAERDRAIRVLPESIARYAASSLAKLVGLCKGWLVSEPQQILAVAKQYDVLPETYWRISPSQWAGYVQGCLALSTERSSSISFDDQLWLPVVMGWSIPEFDWVLVDETQDLNPCQVQIVLRVMAPGARCLAVGDQRQSIYAFRGADVRSMSRLQAALGAKEFPLSVSYRCDRAIVAEAQRLVPDLEACETAGEGLVREGRVSDLLAQAVGGDWIISRKNAPLASLCLQLVRLGKTARILGRKDSSAEFMTLIRRSKAATVPSLTAWLVGFEKKERERLMVGGKEDLIEAVIDRVETLSALCEGLDTVTEVQGRIETLFSDEALSGAIVLSSTHRAKGMEADRVFLLIDTYRPGASAEEDNLLYVGITRARHELVYIEGADKRGKKPAKR